MSSFEKAEIARKEAERIAKRNKKIAIITPPIVCVVIAFIIVLNTVIIPNGKYNNAIALMEKGEYADAISVFETLGDYKDSNAKIAESKTAILNDKYTKAISLMNKGELDDAYLGSGKLLKAAIAKYGKEHFHKSILYVSNSDLENSEKEKQFIDVIKKMAE